MSIFKNFVKRAIKITGLSPRDPAYWVLKLFGFAETDAGIDINEDTALELAPVWSAVSIISGAVGFLPLQVYKRLENGGRELASDHPIYNLIHTRPNPLMSSLVFREAMQGIVMLWGNSYAEVERRNNGLPLALWPLDPRDVEPVMLDGKLVYEVRLKNGLKKILSSDDVLHIKGLGQDGLKGYSVIGFARNNLGLTRATEKYGSKFFANSASPSGILKTPNVLKEDAYKRLKKSFDSSITGLDNAHKLKILEQGLEWQQIGIPPEDAQFLETRRFGIDDISRWFQIPPHMLGNLERATFSNIEHQGIEFVTWSMTRWLKRWELELDYDLLPTSQQNTFFTEFNVDALLRGDTKSRYQAHKLAIESGWRSRNEVRKIENLPPVEGGDVLVGPKNFGPIGQNSQDADKRALLIYELKRIVARESNAVRRAYKKQENFDEWLDEWTESHANFCRNAIEAPLRVYLGKKQADSILPAFICNHIQELKETVAHAIESDDWDAIFEARTAELPGNITMLIL